MSDGPANSALARTICDQVTWLAHQIERVTNAHLASQHLPPGMTMTRAMLLLAIHARNDARMNEVASDLGITARTVTTLVDALQRQALVTRIPDPRDRRAIHLVLTPEAVAIIPALRVAVDAISTAIVAPLNADEQRGLALHLRGLIEPEA